MKLCEEQLQLEKNVLVTLQEKYSTCEGKEKATAKEGPLHGLESGPRNSIWGGESQHKQWLLKYFDIAALDLPIPKMPASACH